MTSKRDLGRYSAVLFAVLVFAYTRSRSLGQLYGNDAYYHLRNVRWTMANFPATMKWDPFTAYPYGSASGQFGTLFDVFVAALGLVLEQFHVQDPALVALSASPVIFGLATLVPVYLITRRVAGADAAVLAMVVLAFIPGIFYHRTMSGFGDHHAAEIFLQATIVYLTMVYTGSRDMERTILATVGAIGAWSVYIATWPPGVYFMAFLVIAHVVIVLKRRRTFEGWTKPYASMVVVGVASILAPALAVVKGTGLVKIGDLHIFAMWTVMGVLIFIMVIDLVPALRRVTILFGTIFLALAAMTAFHQGYVPTGQAFMRSAYIQEAMRGGGKMMIGHLGILVPIALAATTFASYRFENHAVAASWLWLSAVMSIVQMRFLYYLAVPAVIWTAYGVVRAASSMDVNRDKALVIGAVILLVSGPGVAAGSVADVPEHAGTGEWAESLEWVRHNTPDPGVDYYGAANEYPDDAYGIISWWDYGHWITEIARRPAVSNPMQENSHMAATFFTSDGEPGDLHPGIRYAMVDEKMATTKYPAMAARASNPAEKRDSLAWRMYYLKGTGLSNWRLAYDGDVKVYERVKGARITGKSEAGEVSVILQLRADDGTTFMYVQRTDVDNGTYEMTVPYPTEDYGGSVTPVGNYLLAEDKRVVGSLEIDPKETDGDTIQRT